MKKLLIIICILTLIPLNVYADHNYEIDMSDAMASTPKDNTRTTNQYPWFSWTNYIAHDDEFIGATFKLSTGWNSSDIYLFEYYTSEYDTYYSPTNALPRGEYLWQYCITTMSSSYSTYESCTLTRSILIGKRVNKPRHKKCTGNKKFHKMHCKHNGYAKLCSVIK